MLYPQHNTTRSTHSLNGLWQIRFQWPDENPSGWEQGFTGGKAVAVPASFNDLYTSYSERNHWGYVWYQRSFTVPTVLRSERLVLRFGSVSYSADVWLNGHLLGAHETGYTPFEFEINPYLKDEDNVLVVRVNTRLTPETIPQGEIIANKVTGQFTENKPPANFDFFPYGGLHRDVHLLSTPHDHLETIYVDSVVSGTSAQVSFRVQSQGSGDAVRVSIEGESASHAQAAVGKGGQTTVQVSLSQVRLWDVGKPELYYARVELLKGGKVVDTYRQRFGVRTVEIRGDKLLLNGKPVYFTGFGKHEDFFILGKGNNTAVNVRDFELMHWIGANSFRTAHYPYAEEIMDMADEQGFLVVDETPAVSLVPDQATERTLKVHQQATRELIERDYNHPCVVMWCLANEPISFQPEARPYFEKLVAYARQCDPKRPMLLVTCFGDRDVTLDLFDVIGINGYPGWYGGGDPFTQCLAWFSGFLDRVKARVGEKPMFMSEFGADCVSGFHMLPSELWTEDYQRDLLKEVIAMLRSKPYMSGEHIWNFADFRTGQNDRRALGNRKGVFSRDRQPKMAAYMLRDLWTEKS